MGHPTGRERREHGLAARLDDCLDRAGALLTDEAFSAWADDWEALLDEVEALEMTTDRERTNAHWHEAEAMRAKRKRRKR